MTMAKLTAWVKKRLRSKPTAEPQSVQQLPFLLVPRRSVTLASFDTPTCRFFQLPYHIRSTILSMAFGDRSVHMDIVVNERTWKWRGAVCHRNGSRLPSMRYAWLGPWNDPCLDWAYKHKEKFREDYNLGIMGFLLSCREAYTEGIDVLYTTNCIHIQSEPLLLQLPRLIPLNRLSSITSLELVITTHSIEQADTGSSFSIDHLKPILQNILAHCHHLRSLCLSFLIASHKHNILNSPMFAVVDAFYCYMKLRNMRVELPHVAYWESADPESIDNHHPREGPIKGPFERSLWRSLDGEEPRVQSRSIERYPYPPLRLPVSDGDESVESAGYWLAEGYEGPMRSAVCF
jgi:hypothetical protein